MKLNIDVNSHTIDDDKKILYKINKYLFLSPSLFTLIFTSIIVFLELNIESYTTIFEVIKISFTCIIPTIITYVGVIFINNIIEVAFNNRSYNFLYNIILLIASIVYIMLYVIYRYNISKIPLIILLWGISLALIAFSSKAYTEVKYVDENSLGYPNK